MWKWRVQPFFCSRFAWKPWNVCFSEVTMAFDLDAKMNITNHGLLWCPQGRELWNLKSLEKWVPQSIHLMIRYFLRQICVSHTGWPMCVLWGGGVPKGLSLVTFWLKFGESSGKAAWLVGSIPHLYFPALWLPQICVQVQNQCPRIHLVYSVLRRCF